MSVKTLTLQLSTCGNPDVVDTTDQVRQKVVESGLPAGIVTLFSPSSTSGLTTICFRPASIA
jgi:thiamine phosphate synthase YjbQ (UPF0047 family)